MNFVEDKLQITQSNYSTCAHEIHHSYTSQQAECKYLLFDSARRH